MFKLSFLCLENVTVPDFPSFPKLMGTPSQDPGQVQEEGLELQEGSLLKPWGVCALCGSL